MKVYLDMVGCRLNQAEIEQYARQLRQQGHSLVSKPEDADMAVVNTCMVTTAAESDSRQKIRQLYRKGVSELVVTGCWATMKPSDALALPGVSRVVANERKDHLVFDHFSDSGNSSKDLLTAEAFELEPLERQPIPGARQRTRAFIKVQDGCDNHCTFCITTLARGKGRSRSIDEVVSEIKLLLGETNSAAGEGSEPNDSVKEIVLTGVHLGSWGHDLYPRLGLPDLVRTVLTDTGVQRLRLSSLEPWDLDAPFFSLWDDGRMCRHLHLPLQSGCAATLRRMARKTSPQEFASLVAAARSAIPGVAITTDIITGFPGENEEEFQQSLNFIESMNFCAGHVFSYSERPGTAALRLGTKVPKVVSKRRNALVREALEKSAKNYRENFLNQKLPVLWEGGSLTDQGEWDVTGLTDNYLRVWARSPQSLRNEVVPIRLVESIPGGFKGVF